MKKKISVVIPCFNEEDNVIPISEAVKKQFAALPDYDYEIIFIDNDSKDRTRVLIRGLCSQDPHIKAIFNAKNFGQFNSPYYGLLQITGDAGILMAADFQDPPELIPQFVQGWEEGYKIVCAIKTKSRENPVMYRLRGLYYRLIRKLSDTEQIDQFTGYALYDRQFVEVLKTLDDPTPFLRGIVAELGYRHKEIYFTQPLRRAGKSSNNFYKLFDAAMLSFTSYTKAGMRICTLLGMLFSVVFLVIAVVYLILKLTNWYGFEAGMAPVVIGTCFLGSIQLFFIGILGEYVMSINNRVRHRPLVVEEERFNFDSDENPDNPCVAKSVQLAGKDTADSAGDGKAGQPGESGNGGESSAGRTENPAADTAEKDPTDTEEMEESAGKENAAGTSDAAGNKHAADVPEVSAGMKPAAGNQAAKSGK
jgi:glycosyltransferase involved in cell wall biosynthesis